MITLKNGQTIELNQAFNCDCLDFMRELPDKCIDLVLTDPNYGRKEHGGVDRSKYVKQKNGNKLFVDGSKYEKKEWDNEPVSTEILNQIFRVSINQIIFGVNYFPFNPGPGRIVWDKCNDGSDQSDCEIAYNSTNDRVDKIVYMWRGMMQGKSIFEGNIMQGDKSKNEKRIHPTQKPLKLFKWCLEKYAPENAIVFDPFLGSFTTAVACHHYGLKWLGCEKDEDYFKAGYDRYNNECKQAFLEF